MKHFAFALAVFLTNVALVGGFLMLNRSLEHSATPRSQHHLSQLEDLREMSEQLKLDPTWIEIFENQ